MKYLIDKEKLEKIQKQSESMRDPVRICLTASDVIKCLVPYEEKKEEQYKCKSYYDNENILRDCTCEQCKHIFDELKKVQDCFYNHEHFVPKPAEKCMKCNGVGWVVNGNIQHIRQDGLFRCLPCNGTGVEPRKEQDTRCMKCNGVGEKEGEVLLRGFPYNFKRTCNHCNGTGVEPRKEDVITAPRLTREDVRAENFGKYECPPKCSMWNHEQDTRTHAWETKTYTQDEVRKMLEELKEELKLDEEKLSDDVVIVTITSFNMHTSNTIDKKIAEL